MRHALLASVIAFGSIGYHLAEPTPAHAFYCNQRLVNNGDTRYRVRQLCGEPQDMISRVELRSVGVWHRVGGERFRQSVTVEVQIDEWLYDFGRQRFTRRLIFENGRLVRTETGSYGVD
ncbi:MAG: DUF2845 domain-containing protein [Myxococcales bacterium]|nr:DUF2845 domain-containing protein [Myxococcales bacterium]